MNKENIKCKVVLLFRQIMNSRIFLFLLFFTVNTYGQLTPLESVKKVADKVINESSFTYFPYDKRESALIQTIDFPKKSNNPNSVLYAYSFLTTDQEMEILIGIYSESSVKIWLDDKLVYFNAIGDSIGFKEIAYGMYEFPDTFRVKLNQKKNSLLIKVASGENPKINMAAILDDGFLDRDVSFGLEPVLNTNINGNWIYIGPFLSFTTETDLINQTFPPESGFNFSYNQNGELYTWQFSKKSILLDLEIPKDASFKSHPYTEWNYSNGVTMWSILRLAEATGEEKFSNFVKKFCDFTLNDYQLFEHQYFELNEYNGHNNRIFRMHMLDDASGPALPFIQLYKNGELDKAWFLIEKVAKYASKDQFRLEDGTLCRPEPSRWTIWADDLFMYLPFILKYAEITENKSLKADAINQARLFYRHLFDKDKGLYYHGWNSETGKHSAVNWSRANGWVAWAMSELLQNFPGDKKQYKELLKIHKEHLDGLLKYQDESGLWHQVLDHPETYLETSGTAMFTISLARGVCDGWLGKKYKSAAINGWKGIQSRIDPDGTVQGICQGTSIGENVDFYQQRKTLPHDPRGVGTVITAGIEVQKLINK